MASERYVVFVHDASGSNCLAGFHHLHQEGATSMSALGAYVTQARCANPRSSRSDRPVRCAGAANGNRTRASSLGGKRATTTPWPLAHRCCQLTAGSTCHLLDPWETDALPSPLNRFPPVRVPLVLNAHTKAAKNAGQHLQTSPSSSGRATSLIPTVVDRRPRPRVFVRAGRSDGCRPGVRKGAQPGDRSRSPPRYRARPISGGG